MVMPGMPSPAMKHGDSGVWIGKSKITTVDEGGTPVQQELTYPVEASTALKKITPKIITTTTYGPDVYDGHLASPVVYAYLGEHVWVRDGLIFDIYQYDPDTSYDYMGVTPSGKYQGLDYIAIVSCSNIPEEYAASVAASGLRENWFILKLNGAGDYNTLKALTCDPFTNLENGSLAFVYPQSYTQSDLAGNKILDAYGQPKVFFGSVPTDSTAIYTPYVYDGLVVRSKSNFTPLYSTESNYSNINSNNLYSHQVNQWAQGEEIITTSTVLETEITGYTDLENTVSNFSKDTIREYQDQARNGRNEAERNAALAWLNHNVKQTSKTPYNKKTSDIRNQYTDLDKAKATEYYKKVAKYSNSAADRASAKAWLSQHEISTTKSPYTKTTAEIRNEYTDLEGETAIDYYKNVALNSNSASDRATAESWLEQHSQEYTSVSKVPSVTESYLQSLYTDLEGETAVDYYNQVAKQSTSEASRLAATAWLAKYAETPGYMALFSTPTEGKITYSETNKTAGKQGSEAVNYYTQVAKESKSEASRLAATAWLAKYAETPGYETKKEQESQTISLPTELGDNIIVTRTKNTSSEEWINILKAASELNGIDGTQGEEAVRFYELMKKYAPNYLEQKAAGSWLSRYAGTSGHPIPDKDAYKNTAFNYKGIIYDNEALYNTGEFHPLATTLIPKVQYRESAPQEEEMTKTEMIAAQEAVGTTSIIGSPQQQSSWFDAYFKNTPLYSIYQTGSALADYLGLQDEYSRVGQITYDFAKQKVEDINVLDVGDKIVKNVISATPALGPIFTSIDLSKNLIGKNSDLTVSKSDLKEERNKLSSIETTVKNQETIVTSLEPQASKMQSELQTIYDKNVKDGVWMGSEQDLQKYSQLSIEYAPTLERYNDAVKKYESTITEYITQEKNYTDLSQKHTDELNNSSLFMGWYNTFSKDITPTIRDWARSATVDYLMVPTKNVLDTPSNVLYTAADVTGFKEFKSTGDAAKSVTDTIWYNPTGISVYDFLYYGVRPMPEFASEIVGSAPAAFEYAYKEPTDFAKMFPEKLAESAVGTGTFALEHPGAFFGMLAIPTAVKGVKAVPRTLEKLSPGFDRSSVWTGRYTLSDVATRKTTAGTWWEQYRAQQPSFREAMSNSLIDPYLVTDVLKGKKTVTQALSDVWKAGEGPGLGEYISPNRWKTTYYTPKITPKEIIEGAEPTTRYSFSQFYNSKNPFGSSSMEVFNKKMSEGVHATGNVFAESIAIEGKLTVDNVKASPLESGLFLSPGKTTLVPFLEHDYPAAIRVKAPAWNYSQKVRDLIDRAEKYDSDIAILEKKLKKTGLTEKEALKLQDLTGELVQLEKILQEQINIEFADAPANVLIPGPKPAGRQTYHGEYQRESVIKNSSELYLTENWRTQLYGRFGLTRGTKFAYDPKSLQKYEIFDFTTEKPKSVGQKPSVFFDIPEFQKNLFYNPLYRSVIYGTRAIESAVKSPARRFREARGEREILSKIENPETRAAAKATIDTIRGIRGMKSAISLDIDLAALKEVGPELAGPLAELFQNHRVVMYGSGVNLATIPKERLWRELKDADLFIPREEAARFLVDAKKMFKKLGWDVKQDGLQVLSKEGTHLLDIHEAPVDYPLIGGKVKQSDPYTKEDLTPIAAEFMPTRLETGEIFVRESLATQAQRKLNSMLDQFYAGKFKENRAKDFPDGILSVEELLDFAEGKIDANFFKAGYDRAATIAEKTKWAKLADVYSEVKKSTIGKALKKNTQQIRKNLEVIKAHSYVKPLYEAALKKGARYRLATFEQLLREVNEAEFNMGVVRERGGYLDLETGLSRLSKIGEEHSVSYKLSDAGLEQSETGKILDYHTHPLDYRTHPLGESMVKYDNFSIPDLKLFLVNDIKQASVVTGGKTYLFTKGPKTQAKLNSIIKNKVDPFTKKNINALFPAAKLSNYIDGLASSLRSKHIQKLYAQILKTEPGLSKKQYLLRVNSEFGPYASYKAMIYHDVINDIAKDLGCRIEESTFGEAMSRTNINWGETTNLLREMGTEHLSHETVRQSDVISELLESTESPRALINVGYAPYPSKGAGRGTGVSSAITELMQSSVIGGNYYDVQQPKKPITEKPFGAITYDVGEKPESKSSISGIMGATIDYTQPLSGLSRYNPAPKTAKTRKASTSSSSSPQQQTTSPSVYLGRATTIVKKYFYGGRESEPYSGGRYGYDRPQRGYGRSYASPYSYKGPGYNYPYSPLTPTSTKTPPSTSITDGGDSFLWRRRKDESNQRDRRNLKKYHKYSEITGGATAGQAMNMVWGNSTALQQMMGAQQSVSDDKGSGKITVDKKVKIKKTKFLKKEENLKSNNNPKHPYTLRRPSTNYILGVGTVFPGLHDS